VPHTSEVLGLLTQPLALSANNKTNALASDPWADVSHQVSVDPVDDAGIDVSHLEQRWNLWVSGTAIDPNHICHAPGPFRVSDDHGHPCFDMQENGIRLGRSNGARMINRHTPLASTSVLVQERAAGPGNESEDHMASNCLQAQGMEARKSEFLRAPLNGDIRPMTDE